MAPKSKSNIGTHVDERVHERTKLEQLVISRLTSSNLLVVISYMEKLQKKEEAITGQ